MKHGLRQSMAWLHTWAGLLTGWVLFFIFVTGTLGYFDTEIGRWMRPEMPLAQTEISQRAGVELGLARIAEAAPRAERWIVYPPSGHDSANVSLYWRNPLGADGADGVNETLDNRTGEPVSARETGGGEALYEMHYLLHYLPSSTAYWIVGICTMFMFTAIISGVITHRRIFRDFFTFRPRKGQRSWLDIHNVLSVLALPFHLMITYSGLLFLASTYMTLVIAATYGQAPADRDRFFDEANRRLPSLEASGTAAALAPLMPMVAEAERRWGEGQIRSVDVRQPNAANARVVVRRAHETPISNVDRLVFDGTTGALLPAPDRRAGPVAVREAMLGLHEGLFAGPLLRWLYFASGLLGTAMVATGLILWTSKRRKSAPGEGHAGLALVERLNVGTIVGLPIGIAAYFWANRLLPVEMATRAAWELHVLFIVWVLMLAHAALRPTGQAWAEQLRIAAFAFGLLPLLNALTTEQHLAATLPAGAWALAGFDLTALAFGIGCAVASMRVGRRLADPRRTSERGGNRVPQRTAA